MPFDKWLQHLADFLASKSGMTPGEAHNYVFDNRADWACFYEDGYTPSEAGAEDMSLWEP
jgi:hypothetical protein